MPQETSKVADHELDAEAAAEVAVEPSTQQPVAESEDESDQEEATETVEGAEGATKQKKKSRKRRLKDALTGGGKAPEIADADAPAVQHLGKEQLKQLLEANPALKQQLLADKGPESLEEKAKKLSINEMLTGLAPQAKNVKDMGNHAFWKTQPVLSFDEMASGKDTIVDGPIKDIDIDKVSKEPSPMYQGFEWVTMDLEDEKQLDEVYELLTNHYVEDSEAMFRFRYSPSFLNW